MKHSLATRKKMSLKQRGENNSNWKGGLPKCRVCGKQQTVHHSTRCRECARKQGAFLNSRALNFSKENNPRWRGGITALTHIIRDLPETHKWRDEVFAKSSYKCADCGEKGYIEAHHIKPFTKLFKEFVNTYKQFSVVDDKDTLVRLAITYKPFFDVSNGKAVCQSCHEKYRIEARRDNHSAPESIYPKKQTTLK